MPLYEYRCDACEKITEAIQKFSDAPLADCEHCGAKGTLQKLMSRTSFALKGSGWYTTDYKRAPASAPAGETKASDAKPAAKPETKSAETKAPETKPAAPTKTSGGGES